MIRSALVAMLAVAPILAAYGDSTLPQAMLGTWCQQKDDEQGTPMKRCAPGSPNVIRMMPHAMDSVGDHCRVVSVKTLSASRWTVEHVCDSRPDRRYGWTFFRDGETLYLTPVGAYTPLEEGPRRAGPDALGCFTRTYARAHLARHPDQLITAVKLHIYKAPSSPDLVPGQVWFDAQFRLRGKDKLQRTTGTCGETGSGRLSCVVECDGGGVDVVPHARDAMMYLDRIRVATCDEDLIDGGEELTGGKDDRVFRLDRIAAAACTGMDMPMRRPQP